MSKSNLVWIWIPAVVVCAAGCFTHSKSGKKMEKRLSALEKVVQSLAGERAATERLRDLEKRLGRMEKKISDLTYEQRTREKKPAAVSKSGVVKTGSFSYRVDAATFRNFLSNPVAKSRGVRIYPFQQGGKPAGLRVMGLRPKHLFYRLGLRSGDVVLTMNGMGVGNPARVVKIFQSLKSAKKLKVSVLRGGRVYMIVYTIVNR